MKVPFAQAGGCSRYRVYSSGKLSSLDLPWHKHGGSSALKATLPLLRQTLTHQTSAIRLAEDYSFFRLKTINF